MREQQWTAQQILEGIRKDDQRIIGVFYYGLQRKASAVLCRQVMPGSREALAFEECFSKAVMTIIAKVQQGTYQDKNFWSFAIGVVKYAFLEAKRKILRRRWADLETVPEIPDSTLPPCATAQQVFERRDHPSLSIWFEQLDACEKTLLDYRVQGYQHDEIAPMLSLASGTVRNRFAKLVRTAQHIVRKGQQSAA